MVDSFGKIDELLPGYFSGELSDKERVIIDDWRSESPENEGFYHDSLKAWDAITLLHEMEQFNSFEALRKVNTKITQSSPTKWWISIQRVAAILMLPLMVYSGYVTIQNRKKSITEHQVVMQTVSSRQGMVTQFTPASAIAINYN